MKKAKYSTAAAEKVTLTRPFAQVNVATADLADVKSQGVAFTEAQSTITVTNVANTFDMFSSKATYVKAAASDPDQLDAKFTIANVPAEKLLNVGTENKSYDYLAMAYVLVPNADGASDNTSVSDITATVKATGIDSDVNVKYEGATLKQNHRTNIIGDLLTTGVTYMAEIDSKFTETDYDHLLENVTTPKEANLAFAAGETGVRIEKVEEDATLVLPKTTEEVTVLLPATDKALTFEYPADATEYPEVLNITVPEGTNPEGANLVLNVKNTTVYVNGVLQTVTASTAVNTLVVTDGTVITNLVVKAGNVRIEKGGEVKNISRDPGNKSVVTVYLGEGVTQPSVDPADSKIEFVPFTTPEEGQTLAEQIAATTYGKVTLTEDEVLDAPLTIAAGKEITLDLNGHTLSYTSTVAATSYMIENKANLTIKNGTLVFAATTPDTEWGGEGQPEYPGYANNTIRNSGVLTIENATLENKTKKGGASYVIDNYAGANLTVNEGSVLTQSGGDIAIRMFNSSETEINVTINGGAISGYRAVWIHLAGSQASTSPAMNLTINGGTLNSVDQEYNSAIYSYTYGNDAKDVNITISGGVFNGDIALTGGENKENLETLTVYGGTFNGDVYSYGDDAKAAKAITIKGGTFSSFGVLDYVAKDNQNVVIELPAGSYVIPTSTAGRTLTICGTEETEISVQSGLTYANGANITFNGITIQSDPEGAGYTNGFADFKYATFNNCIINGTLGLDFSCEFNKCEFNIEGNYYNVWTWGAGTAKFNNCTFNCDGKALLVYANVLDNGSYHQTVNIVDCVFNDNGDDTVTGKAAIEISNTYTPIRTYDVIINNTTVNGFTTTVPGTGDFNAAYGSVEDGNIGTNVWGNKCKLSNEYLNVMIDGVDVY